MRRVDTLLAASLALMTLDLAQAQVAGSTVPGVAAAKLLEVAAGWSATRQVLGRPVFNDKKDKIGTVDDIFISPDKAVSYAIVGAGGFLGCRQARRRHSGRSVHSSGRQACARRRNEGAITAMPPFEYAPR